MDLINFPEGKDSLKQGVEIMKRELPSLVEYYQVSAKLQFKVYQEYLSAGFDKDQALILVKGLFKG